MKRLAILIILILLLGCATTPKINDVKLGMTKKEVVEVMGTPASTSAQGNTMYLNYSLYDPHTGYRKLFYVKLVDDKVDSYGHREDSASAKTSGKKPTINLNVDMSVGGDKVRD